MKLKVQTMERGVQLQKSNTKGPTHHPLPQQVLYLDFVWRGGLAGSALGIITLNNLTIQLLVSIFRQSTQCLRG